MYALGALLIGIVLLYVFMSSVEGFANTTKDLMGKKEVPGSETVDLYLLMKSSSDITFISSSNEPVANIGKNPKKLNNNTLSIVFNENYKIHDYAIYGFNKQKKNWLLGYFGVGGTTPTLFSVDPKKPEKEKDKEFKRNSSSISSKEIKIKSIAPSAVGGIDNLSTDSTNKANIKITLLVSNK